MRFTAIAGLLLSWNVAAEPSPSVAKTNAVVVRQHFVGLEALGTRTDLPALRTLLALPESQRIITHLATNLGATLPTWFGKPTPDPDPAPNSESEPKAEPELKPELEPKPNSDLKPDSEPDPDSEPKVDPELKRDPEPKPDTEPEPELEPKPELDPNKPDSEPKPDVEPEQDSEPKPAHPEASPVPTPPVSTPTPEPTPTNYGPVLAPVVRSLLNAESFLEVCTADDAAAVTGWALAAKLETEAAASATRELGRILSEVLKAEPPAEDASEWEIAAGEGRPRAKCQTVEGWLVVSSGTGALDSVLDRLRAPAGEGEAKTNAVLEGTWDFQRLAKLVGWPDAPAGPVDQWPVASITAESRNKHLRTVAKLAFARDLELDASPWKIPKDFLRDPIVGFTAVRNADVWLRRLSMFAASQVEDWPGQIFFWSLADKPWQQYFAAPAKNPTNVLIQTTQPLAINLVSASVWRGQEFGLRVTNQATRVDLLVRGLPFFSPFLRAVGSGDEGFIQGGLFPLSTAGSPAPAELLSQVEGRTNLVWYDWETSWQIVGTNPPNSGLPRVSTNLFGRPIQWMHLAQWSANARRKPSGSPSVPGDKWLPSAVPYLGNTVTEVIQSGPSELTLTRHSESGWTGLELLALLRWFEDPQFPGWSELPPPSDKERVPIPGRLLPGN